MRCKKIYNEYFMTCVFIILKKERCKFKIDKKACQVGISKQ